jgi:hypothetical protein
VKLTIHFHLVPRSRMRGAIPPLLQYVFMAWCLVKHRDNFTFFYSEVKTCVNIYLFPVLCPCTPLMVFYIQICECIYLLHYGIYITILLLIGTCSLNVITLNFSEVYSLQKVFSLCCPNFCKYSIVRYHKRQRIS